MQLLLDRVGMDHSWWWKLLWKFKCPLKEKIFCLFLLSNKPLTWDIIVRKGREGTGRCYLCKLNIETNLHLGVECPFTQCVWMNLEDILKLNNLWYGGIVSDFLKTWRLNMKVKHIKTLPIIVLWNIWKAINLVCFEDISMTPAQVSIISLGLMRSLPQDSLVVNIKFVGVEDIDKTYPWGYFDGSSAGDPKICGARGPNLHY